MPTLVVPANVMPCQVDDFPEGCERSKEGAIYVRPAAALSVTNDEVEHLKAKHPDLARRLIVVPDKPKAKDKADLRDPMVAKVAFTLGDRVRMRGDAALEKAVAEREKRGKAKLAARKEAADAVAASKAKKTTDIAYARAVEGAKNRGEKPPKFEAFLTAQADQAQQHETRLAQKAEQKKRGVLTGSQRRALAKQQAAQGFGAPAKPKPATTAKPEEPKPAKPPRK